MKKSLLLCLALMAGSSAQMASASDEIARLLSQAGLSLPIKEVKPAKVANLQEVHLAGAEPIFISQDGRYVLQGRLEANPSPKQPIADELKVAQTAGTPISLTYKQAILANMTSLKNLTADSAFFYTNVAGLLWGVSGEGGVPFLLSDDGRYFINGEISVIQDGQFAGLDADFEWTKNRHVLATLDEKWLTIYPAKRQKAVMYIATDTHCPYCRLLHQQIPALTAKGVTVKVIGYPVYDEAQEPMRQIWCETNNAKRATLLSLAMKGVSSKSLCQSDENHLIVNQKLAQALAVVATPAIYREDGVLFEGDFRGDELLAFLGVK